MPCIHLEIIYQGSHCPASHYMDKAVEEVLPLYGDQVRYTRVEYKKSQTHSQRFLELSVSLFGESAVRHRLQTCSHSFVIHQRKIDF